MEFKSRTIWKKNRSVLKKDTTPGGQIIYKGETEVHEEDEEGNRVAATTDRFLIRVGKKVSKQVMGTTVDAKKELIRLLGSVGNTSHLSGGRTKLAAYLRDSFLPACRGRNLAAAALDYYEYAIENYIIPVLGTIRLEDLTVQHFRALIRDLRQTKGLAAKTVKTSFGCLRTALNEAIADGLIEQHDATSEKIKLRTLLRRSKAEKKERNLKQRLKAWAYLELLQFFRVAPADDELSRLALVGCKTGMPPGELWIDAEAATYIFPSGAQRYRDPPDFRIGEFIRCGKLEQRQQSGDPRQRCRAPTTSGPASQVFLWPVHTA